MYKKNNFCKPSQNLFIGKPRLGWFKDIKIYIKRVFFLIKHGYSEQAQWETYTCFMDATREILTYYRYHREGTPCKYELDSEYNDKLDKMLELLDLMDEDNSMYEGMTPEEIWNEVITAKDEFFKLYSECFFDFWD